MQVFGTKVTKMNDVLSQIFCVNKQPHTYFVK